MNHVSDKDLYSEPVKNFLVSLIKQLHFLKRAKNFNEHFARQDICMADKHLKNCSTSLDIRKMEIESIVITTIYLLECLKLKRSTVPSVDEDVKELGLSYTTGRNVKWYTTLANGLAGF